MKPRPACLPCILQQTFRVARQASNDDWTQRKVLNDVMKALGETDWNRSPADVLGDAIGKAREIFRAPDPFAEPRAEVQQELAALAQEVRQRVAAADDPFALAVAAATAANVVDELILRPVDLAAQLWAGVDDGFALGRIDQLRDAVQSAHRILYLIDNAGEVLFDAIVVEQLRQAGKRVRVVARGGGLLHDATAADARDAGLEPPASDADPAAELIPDPQRLPDLLELPHGVLGTPLPPTHKHLKEAVAEADLVIAKGSANYETFTAKQAKVPTVVYLLRAKCEPVAQSLGVPVGSLVLLRSAGQPRTGVIKRPTADPNPPPTTA
ncbi:MAG: ARMT1-like domain-containing protein [Planctomycetes bacterium]|nr:ARMT1-like domain-containing protein [Planctomycetota bacterium]